MSYTVLVPHDQSDAAEGALAWAADLVRSTGGAVQLLHVVPIPPPTSMPVPAYSPFPIPEDLEIARGWLRDAAKRHGLNAPMDVLVAANIGESIVHQATTHGATLIVMGTHGRGGMKRAVLGSVADYVVRHAHCPVVTVRVPSSHAARKAKPGSESDATDAPPTR